MLEKGELARRLYEEIRQQAEGLTVTDVRIGLGYVAVRLEENRLGLAAVLRNELKSGCSLLNRAGTLAGSRVSDLLVNFVKGGSPLEKAVGLATANALICPEIPAEEDDAISLMQLTPEDTVAMVGFFGPLMQKIKKTGAKLSVIERDSELCVIPDQKNQDKMLKGCSVAIITATSLMNETAEEILNKLDSPRHVVMLGPSTPLAREIFQGTPVTHLGGSAILDIDKILQIVSEGGGTPVMRPWLRFINVMCRI